MPIHSALSHAFAAGLLVTLGVVGVAGCGSRPQTNQFPTDDGEGSGSAAPSTQPSSGGSSSNGDTAGSGDDAGTTAPAPSSSSTTPPPATDAAPPAAAPSPTVMGLTLMDADADQPITGFDPIAEGATITLANLPTQNITIQAKVVSNGATIGSIVFDFDGTAAFHTENMAPYSLSGDNNGDFLPLSPTLTTGAHQLKATPYPEANGAGTAGVAKMVNFTVQ